MNIFERAVRADLRFASSRGQVTTSQLFQLGLTDLDTIAKRINALLKAEGEESFIETTSNAAQADLTLRLDILKHVIASKMSDAQAAETRAVNATRRARLNTALANKQDAALGEMSEKDIQEELDALNA